MLRTNRKQNCDLIAGKGSMQKTSLVCSLLVAFGLSTLIVGCEPAKTAGTKAVKKPSGKGSTTGGGAEVPAAPSKGAAEIPKVEAPKAESEPAVEEKPKAEAEPAVTEEKPKTEN
jgi:hypothetical protein